VSDAAPARRVLLLQGDPARARNDNHQRLPNAFAALGWAVTVADHEALWLAGERLLLDGQTAGDFALIWLLGFGPRGTFLDRVQLLARLPAERFVNRPDQMLLNHGKLQRLSAAAGLTAPETWASADVEDLLEPLAAGGDWLLKPAAGSYGRGVRTVSTAAELRAAAAEIQRMDPGYLLLQRRVVASGPGELRTLMAGGRCLGSYRRTATDGLRANLAAGGAAERARPDPELAARLDALAALLAGSGIGFAAVDSIDDRLLEVNLANPGGLATLSRLYGVDAGRAAVQAVLAWRGLL